MLTLKWCHWVSGSDDNLRPDYSVLSSGERRIKILTIEHIRQQLLNYSRLLIYINIYTFIY